MLSMEYDSGYKVGYDQYTPNKFHLMSYTDGRDHQMSTDNILNELLDTQEQQTFTNPKQQPINNGFHNKQQSVPLCSKCSQNPPQSEKIITLLFLIIIVILTFQFILSLYDRNMRFLNQHSTPISTNVSV